MFYLFNYIFIIIIVLLLLFQFFILTTCLNSNFWYSFTKPPETQYISVPYANCSVLIDRPFHDGPGQDLLTDPIRNPDGTFQSLYAGNTINRQSFDTQFVLDLEYALGIDKNRIFVSTVRPSNVHFTHETTKVIVQFIILERNGTQGNTLLEAIALLTNLIQNVNSTLYHKTNVTNSIDPLWGLLVDTWDISLKLSYAIEVIGRGEEIDGYYLNQGGLGACDINVASLYPNYCEFERFFEDDVSRALNISYYRIQILFIKADSLDSVLVYFRVLPPRLNKDETNVIDTIANLVMQVPNLNSELYKGNVTIRVDPLWGVSDKYGILRKQEPLFTYKYYKYDPKRLNKTNIMTNLMTSYDRCKANRRCNWGIQRKLLIKKNIYFFLILLYI